MKGIRFVSHSQNSYCYDNETGLIYPETSCPATTEQKTPKPEATSVARATAEDIRAHLAIHGYKQLLLEVTQVCNLRCRYCCYSEHYLSTRNHGNASMTFDTARKAIDMYMQQFIELRHINPVRNPVISFYGGEPLANFALIKQVLSYFSDTYPGYQPDYNLTTNALLLTDETADILVDHNFSIIVSLDGDKENHDRNRRKINGEGSFDEVFGNILKFKKRHPGYHKFGLSTCFDYDTDLEKVTDFITRNELFVVIANKISDQETDYYKKFSAADIQRFNRQLLNLRDQYFALAKKNGILLNERSFLLSLFAFGYIDFACHPVLDEKRPAHIPYGGSCTPGEKIYITVDGHIHMCERISPHFPIGTLDEGLQPALIAEYVNQYNACTHQCTQCDISRLCDICMAKATDKNRIAIPENYCRERRQYIRNLLTTYVDLMEANPGQLEEISIAYYDNMRQRIGNILD